MIIRRITRETHPTEFVCLDRMEVCGEKAHGRWITHPDGDIECRDCGEILGRIGPVEEPECIDFEEDTEDDSRPPAKPPM